MLPSEAGTGRSTTELLAYRHELTVEELAAQVEKIHAVMQRLMKDEIHYGTIPGTRKPTLYKPGAELLCMLFRLDPQPAVEEIREAGHHLTVRSTTVLWHIPTGLRWGAGMGSCSTHESKYAYRKSGRTCPDCQKEDTIIKGKPQYGGGWVCFLKRGGCGAKFKDGDAAIETQQTEQRVPNPDLPDTHNTVLKMANKRSLVAAVLNVTAASEIFTQDLDTRDEDDEPAAEGAPPRTEPPGREADQARGPADPASPDLSPVISPAQGNRLHAIARGSGWSDDQLHDLLAGYQCNSSKEITRARYEEIVERIKRGPARP